MRNEITLYRDDYKTINDGHSVIDCFDEMLLSQFGVNESKLDGIDEVTINLSSGAISFD